MFINLKKSNLLIFYFLNFALSSTSEASTSSKKDSTNRDYSALSKIDNNFQELKDCIHKLKTNDDYDSILLYTDKSNNGTQLERKECFMCVLTATDDELNKLIDEKYNLLKQMFTIINEKDVIDFIILFYGLYIKNNDINLVVIKDNKTEITDKMDVLIQLNNKKKELRNKLRNEELTKLIKLNKADVKIIKDIIVKVKLIKEDISIKLNEIKEVLTANRLLNLLDNIVKEWEGSSSVYEKAALPSEDVIPEFNPFDYLD